MLIPYNACNHWILLKYWCIPISLFEYGSFAYLYIHCCVYENTWTLKALMSSESDNIVCKYAIEQYAKE